MEQRRPRRVTEADVRIGARLRDLRVAHGESQTRLAGILGITFQQIQKYERGKTRLSAARLDILSRHFGVSAAEFLSEGITAINGHDLDPAVVLYIKSPQGREIIDACLRLKAPQRRTLHKLVRQLAAHV